MTSKIRKRPFLLFNKQIGFYREKRNQFSIAKEFGLFLGHELSSHKLAFPSRLFHVEEFHSFQVTWEVSIGVARYALGGGYTATQSFVESLAFRTITSVDGAHHATLLFEVLAGGHATGAALAIFHATGTFDGAKLVGTPGQTNAELGALASVRFHGVTRSGRCVGRVALVVLTGR